MTKTIALTFSFFIFPLITAVSQEKQSEVLIISTIHGAHKANLNYSYDSLFKFIDSFDPEIIGVEIREEDRDSSFNYLKNNYPFEMYECLKKYPSKTVMGFDWLGSELEGKAIPENYWRNSSAIKQLQIKLNRDSIVLQKLSVLDIIKEEKNRLVLNSSLFELNDGKYDLINYIYYEQLYELLKGTEYIKLSDFYQQRDEHIAQNIIEIIKNNKGKRLIFLVGADHRYHTLEKVSSELGNQILLNKFN